MSHRLRVGGLIEAKQFDKALLEAQQAVSFAPDSAQAQLALGDALTAAGRKEEAKGAYERAKSLAETIAPEFQLDTEKAAKEKLAK
jgi:Flp pilus assembly protein TadD